MPETRSAPAGLREMQPHCRLVQKPWGHELVWAENDSYVGKMLQIDAGKRLSLQYHDSKLESQCLLAGRALLVVEDAAGALCALEMEPGKGYTIQPFRRHRLVAISDATVLEVSTPEIGTTFRVEDDYARPHETEAARRQEGAR